MADSRAPGPAQAGGGRGGDTDTGAAAAAPGPHVHRGTRAVQRLVEYAPASGGLALWLQHRDVPDPPDEDPRTPALAAALAPVFTDGRTLHYRPGFADLPLRQQAGWVAHLVLHVALRHAQRHALLRQRLGDVDLQLYNTCADAIVNSALSHLGWLDLPPGAVHLPRLLHQALALQQDTDAALLAWDLETLYAAIDDRPPPEPEQPAARRRDGARAARVRSLGGQGQRDLFPAPGSDSAPEDEAEQTRTWAERLQRAQAGDGPLALVRTLLADLPKSRTPWEQLLRVQLARALAQQPTVSWSRPARSYLANQGRLRGAGGGHGGTRPRAAAPRLPWEPGRSSSRPVPRLVLVVDVSGSIQPDLLQRFGAEVQALARRHGAALVLVIGDDQVQQVLHHQPGRGSLQGLLRDLRATGGGTDFRPLLAEACTHRPDLVLVLTDLDGPAGEPPGVPVLWAVPVPPGPAGAQGPALQPPFGRVLALR